jgi:lipopolysaccharide transport system ATP-binding protein
MSSEVAIHVNQLYKSYQLYNKPHDRLKQSLLPPLYRAMRKPPKRYFTEFAALSNVSFDVSKGETVAIIGRNGSGKSTLLQIICGTLNQSSGVVQVNGRLAALLELGAGFNPDFSGLENVRMSCSLLGLSADEIEAKMDDILAFADIGNFVDQPVKTYSSGMYVRLAFATNIVAGPDIMVVDEALAVGDLNFQAKCMTALTRIQESGATVLFVSHDITAVRSLCSRAIYLERGTVKAIGMAPDITDLYLRHIREEMNAQQVAAVASKKTLTAHDPGTTQARQSKLSFVRSEEFNNRAALTRYGTGGARVTHADILDRKNESARHFAFDEEVSIVVCFESHRTADLISSYYILDGKRNSIVGCEKDLRVNDGGRYTITYKTRLPLREGNYSLQIELSEPIVYDESAEYLDVIDDAVVFQMARKPRERIWAEIYLPNSVDVVDHARSESLTQTQQQAHSQDA